MKEGREMSWMRVGSWVEKGEWRFDRRGIRVEVWEEKKSLRKVGWEGYGGMKERDGKEIYTDTVRFEGVKRG